MRSPDHRDLEKVIVNRRQITVLGFASGRIIVAETYAGMRHHTLQNKADDFA
jgi:hypothetical protein